MDKKLIVVRARKDGEMLSPENCMEYEKYLQKYLGEDYLVIVSPFNIYSPDGSAPMLVINDKTYTYKEVINKLKSNDSNVCYVDWHLISEGKMGLTLYKNQNVYTINNSHCKLPLENMVDILCRNINKEDKIYIDTHGFGQAIYDCMINMDFNVCELNNINVNLKLF